MLLSLSFFLKAKETHTAVHAAFSSCACPKSTLIPFPAVDKHIKEGKILHDTRSAYLNGLKGVQCLEPGILG